MPATAAAATPAGPRPLAAFCRLGSAVSVEVGRISTQEVDVTVSMWPLPLVRVIVSWTALEVVIVPVVMVRRGVDSGGEELVGWAVKMLDAGQCNTDDTIESCE